MLAPGAASATRALIQSRLPDWRGSDCARNGRRAAGARGRVEAGMELAQDLVERANSIGRSITLGMSDIKIRGSYGFLKTVGRGASVTAGLRIAMAKPWLGLVPSTIHSAHWYDTSAAATFAAV